MGRRKRATEEADKLTSIKSSYRKHIRVTITECNWEFSLVFEIVFLKHNLTCVSEA